MKALLIIIALTSWLPWTENAQEMLADACILDMETPCVSRGGYRAGLDKIWVCRQMHPADFPMVILHESQHHLLWRSGIEVSPKSKFLDNALDCLAGNDERRRELLRRKFGGHGGYGWIELHAQLPWMTRGDICPGLQQWYPWFDLVATSEETDSNTMGAIVPRIITKNLDE